MRIAANSNPCFSESSVFQDAAFQGTDLGDKIWCYAQENLRPDRCHAEGILWR